MDKKHVVIGRLFCLNLPKVEVQQVLPNIIHRMAKGLGFRAYEKRSLKNIKTVAFLYAVTNSEKTDLEQICAMLTFVLERRKESHSPDQRI